MINELLMFKLIVAIAGILSLFLCIFAHFKLKGAPGVRPYKAAALLSALFAFFYVSELSSTTLSDIKLWIMMEYLVMPFIPALLFIMCSEYVGQKLKTWVYYLLFSIPCFTIFMQATNNLHHLYYSSVGLSSDAPFPIARMEYGPFFYIHALYLFLCLVVSVLTLARQLKSASFIFRIQILAMMAGLVFPVLANYFYLNGLSPYGIDLGPVSMSLSYIFHCIALLSFKMFNVTPIFRDTVFDRMQEGVIVLNQNGIILDYNQAMLPIIPSLHAGAIGKPITEILEDNSSLQAIIDIEENCDYKWIHNNKTIYHQVQFSEIQSENLLKVGQIVTFVNITEKIELQEQLKQLASIDGLTQVYNRTYFMKLANELLHTKIHEGGSLSLIMFDIDHFKKVNDDHGHETGDIVLSHIARIAKKCIQESDIIGRYGGEEFVILLPNTTKDEAYMLANIIRVKALESPSNSNNTVIPTTLSLGVSHTLVTPSSTGTIKHLMREADQALYTAKRNGRNNVQIYLKADSKQTM
ncbi:histidine kinase N-terminal 7TM domain-containing protein [Niallia taxi]|uniref:histidine kinase N-terminal 7TM domain-containing diguanylate cyclase n=1 Tax=Niallia taxi TaxID=2499688 RepID=UPI003D26D733